MKRIALLLLVGLMALAAAPRPAERASTAKFHNSSSPRPSSALVDPQDRVLNDLAAGGGWETIITFINMSGAPAAFTLTFYDDNGNFRVMPLLNSDGSLSRSSAIDFALDPNTSNELILPNVDSRAKSAWSYLSLASDTQGVAALAVVRYKDAKGRVVSEATESLSNTQDYDFFAPFDNIDGVTTGLILVNPGNSGVANVNLSAQDAFGNELVRDRIQLPAGARTVFSLSKVYPNLADISGKLRVTSDVSTLSAICFRVSPAGNLAFSPIFNWSGMFR